MNILSRDDLENIELLTVLDSKAINSAFDCSNTIGLGQFSSSIKDYTDYLRMKHGEIVLSHCAEYRTYILKLLEKIDDKYKESAISELINPKVKKMTGIEFLEILHQVIIQSKRKS